MPKTIKDPKAFKTETRRGYRCRHNYFQMVVGTIQEFKTKSSFDRRPSNYHGKLYLDWMKIQGHEYSRNIDMNEKKSIHSLIGRRAHHHTDHEFLQ